MQNKFSLIYGGQEGPHILFSKLPNKAISYHGCFQLWLFLVTNFSHFLFSRPDVVNAARISLWEPCDKYAGLALVL